MSSSSPSRGSGSRTSSALYLAVLLGLPLVIIPAMILLGRSEFFLRHGASVWVQANDAVFSMRGRHCELLIFGDSTAMTGLDPAVIGPATGLETCNIAVTNAVLAVVGELPLDRFLAQNERPRVLLVQLSPDDFERSSHRWENTIYGEGLLELLRHGSGSQVRAVVWTHRRETLAFAGYVAGFTAYYGIRWVWSRVTGRPMEERTVAVRNGFFTMPLPPLTRCDSTTQRVNEADRAFPQSFVDGLRTRYDARAGVVLVDAAPLPACDDNLAGFRQLLAGLTSNEVTGLPIGLFNDERHYTAEGARAVSLAAAAQVRRATSER